MLTRASFSMHSQRVQYGPHDHKPRPLMKKNSAKTTTTPAIATTLAIHRYKFAAQKPAPTGDDAAPAPVLVGTEALFMMPEGAVVVDFAISMTSGPYLLALVNPHATDEQMEPRTFRIVKTGEEFPATARYIRSLNLGGPALHLLEVL